MGKIVQLNTSKVFQSTLITFMMAIISKLQFALVSFLLSLFVDASEARRRGGGGFFVVIFSEESGPVWIGICVAISVLSILCCVCRCMMSDDEDEEIEQRFQNQPMPAGPAHPVPYTIEHPVPYTIDMSDKTSSSDLPPNYQQATNIVSNKSYSHYGFTS